MTISSLTPVEEKYSSVKQLIELGKEKGYLLYDEIYEMLPEEVVSLPDELDEIYIRFSDLGIDVIDRPERYQNRDDFESGGTNEFDKEEDETTEFGLATLLAALLALLELLDVAVVDGDLLEDLQVAADPVRRLGIERLVGIGRDQLPEHPLVALGELV